MLASRTILRSTRLASSRPLRAKQVRFQSTTTTTSSSTNHALVGGLAGGATALIGCYAWYHFSGAKTLVNAAHETKEYISSAQRRLVENAPKPNEALRWLRQVTTYYAGFVPGAKGVVESALDDIDAVHDKHADEVDQIIQDAYKDLKKLSGEGMSMQTAQKAWDTLQTHLQKIGELAKDAADQVLDNHPEIKRQLGGNLDQLKKLGEQYGPEAKKQVDETWDQIKDITKSGMSKDTVDKIRKLVQEKTEQLQKLGDETWKRGLEKAKPYLDKNSKIKELIEKNAQQLKGGNFEQLFEKVKKAAESGDTGDLEKHIKDAAGKAKESGSSGLDQLLKSIPGGDQILPKLQHLQEIAEKHGDEAKKLLDETIHDVTDVLSKKADKAKELAKDAEKKSSR